MARNRIKLGSLVKQAEERLNSQLAMGESKYKAQKLGLELSDDSRSITKDKVYSWETYRAYLNQTSYFVKYCKANYDVKTLEDCKKYVHKWLEKQENEGKKPSSIKTTASSLAKIYGCKSSDFGFKTKDRKRNEITRSRGVKARDKNFSENKNAELVSFCRSTGLRRGELRALTGDKLVYDIKKGYCINVNSGSKGGRPRLAPIIGDVKSVIEKMNSVGNGKVFEKISSAADIHSYRADYATSLYKEIARPFEELNCNLGVKGGSTGEAYVCRGDLKGVVYDRKAMEVVSDALGHSRVSVIAGHYLRSNDIREEEVA